MKRLKQLAAWGLVASLLVTVVSVSSVTGQVKQGKTRPAKTKYLMKGLVAANCGALSKGLKAGPKTDEDWDTLAMQASLLNEAGHLLLADGRCPDGDWAKAAKTLQGCSAAALKAIEAKDVEKATTAFSAMTKSCGACHKVHKK